MEDVINRSDYHPTIWRTCRALANMHRLSCLKTVIEQPLMSVEDVASATGLPANKVSMHLRALQSRGLLQALRQSRWVRYQPQPDPLVPSAPPILSALQTALRSRPEKEIVQTLTAFTHPRRLSILRCLQLQPAIPEEALSISTQISPPALWRHLKKLENRGLVVRTEEGWRLHPRPTRLTDVFLALIALELP